MTLGNDTWNPPNYVHCERKFPHDGTGFIVIEFREGQSNSMVEKHLLPNDADEVFGGERLDSVHVAIYDLHPGAAQTPVREALRTTLSSDRKETLHWLRLQNTPRKPRRL